jgi:hypothetical protein
LTNYSKTTAATSKCRFGLGCPHRSVSGLRYILPQRKEGCSIELEMVTKEAGHPWVRIDLKGSLARWLASVDEEERAEWFKNPSDIELYAKTEWKDVLTEFFQKEVARATTPERTVFALTGLMDLYDFLHVSELIDGLEKTFPGFLLVFFPGEKEGNTYRFLDARTGWNYLAAPILSEK